MTSSSIPEKEDPNQLPVDGLPERFTNRKFSARIVDRLKFTRGSALYGEVRQHTNPKGVISDTAMQRLIMNSVSDGAIRSFIRLDDYEDRAFHLVNEYFEAIRMVFGPEWTGMTPRTSRLKHGAGIVAMGFVMELLHSTEGATTRDQFADALRLIKPHTAWTSGQWNFSSDDICPWNGIQNTPGDIDALANHLVRLTKRALRKHRLVVNG